MDVQTGNTNAWYLLGLIAVCGVLALWVVWSRRSAARKFASPQLHPQLLPAKRMLAQFVSAVAVAASLLFLVLALLDLRWGKTDSIVPQKGIELMFALDVSRSMLAEDAAPNRLERAKQQIKDIVAELAGDRVGLVVFAGEARQYIPLTNHYDDFKQMLEAVSPESVRRGGTRLGDAIQAAAGGFLSKTPNHKTIVIFTDGEDHESQPLEVAKKLHAEQGVRMFAVGLGDAGQGARIPDQNSRQQQYLEFEGQQVWSKQNGKLLQQVAVDTGGAYIPAGTKHVDMGAIYHRFIARVEKQDFGPVKINAYIPRFQWFAVPALIFMIVEISCSTARSHPFRATRNSDMAPRSDDVGNGFRRKSQQVGGSTGSKRAVAAYLVCLACVQTTIVAAAPTESIHEQINAAIALVNQQKIDLAIDAFSRITGANGLLLDHLNYNKGVAYYRKGDFDAAQKLFEQAARSDDSQVASKARFNLGNSHYSRALTLAVSQPPSAIAALKSAVDSYRSSLRLDADNADARANIEIAQKLIQQLEQQQQQQQQDKQASNPQQEQQSPGQNSNDEAQQKQQPSDQSHQSEDHQDQPREDQSGEQEQNRADENSEPKRDDLSGGQNGQQQEKEGETQTGDESLDRNDNRPQQTDEHDPASDQAPDSQRQNVDQESQPDNSRAGEQTDAQADQLNQPPDSQSAPQSNEQVDRQNSAERPKTERDDRKQPPAAVEKRNEGKPETPLGELKSINPDNDSLKEDNPQAIHGATRMTNEEAMKLLQSIRDRDLLRRLLQKQKERARRVPVEKDW